MKKFIRLILVLAVVFSLAGCTSNEPAPEAPKEKTSAPAEISAPAQPKEAETIILVAAAASLKNAMDKELIPMFTEKHPNIKINATYDSSGKLQAQIEEGADVDVFFSAAMKQMNALNEKGMIEENSIVQLFENKIVLIVPKGSQVPMSEFKDMVMAETIAIGDPESVPAGQYAKESLENLGLWDQVSALSSLGTNVTEVLNWVAEGSADAGIVYATDSASNENVEVKAEAPEGSVSKIIYPVGIVKSSEKQEAAKIFSDFLQSEDAMEIFKSYGFTPNK